MTARLVLLLALFVSVACGPTTDASGPRTFTVAAAASLAEPLDELLALWNGTHEVHGRATYAGSGTLARQVLDGAPIDLLVSAHPRWTELLDARGLLDVESARTLAGNALCVVRPARLRDRFLVDGVLVEERFVGVRWTTGEPDAVPLGGYARQALEHRGTWERLAPRLVPAADARAALRLVARGEVDWAVVYASDARDHAGLVVLEHVDPSTHDPIEYRAAPVRGARPEARAFLAWLTEPQQRAVFERHGFGTASGGPR